MWRWPLHQIDVFNAFLHGFLNTPIYMDQLQGFIDQTHPNYVCLLHHSLYGLQQAPRAWFNRLHTFLQSLGFQSSKSINHSLFFE